MDLTYMHNSFGVCLVISIMLSNYWRKATITWHIYTHNEPKIKGHKNNIKGKETYQGHKGKSWSHLSASEALYFYLVPYLNYPQSMSAQNRTQEYI